MDCSSLPWQVKIRHCELPARVPPEIRRRAAESLPLSVLAKLSSKMSGGFAFVKSVSASARRSAIYAISDVPALKRSAVCVDAPSVNVIAKSGSTPRASYFPQERMLIA